MDINEYRAKLQAKVANSDVTEPEPEAPAAEAPLGTAQITEATAALAFLFAGRALFTLVSKKTGARFTYKMRRASGDDENRPWFVSVLTGSNNEGDYSYIGVVFPNNPERLVHTRKSKVTVQAPSFRAVAWFLNRLHNAADALAQVEFWHEGQCGRCGRVLTVPESIKTGLGPVCAKMA